MCAYEDAEVLGVRLEYFISGRQSEFLAGQLAVGKSWHTPHLSPVCPPRSASVATPESFEYVLRSQNCICICSWSRGISLLANLCDVCTQKSRKRRHCLAANCF